MSIQQQELRTVIWPLLNPDTGFMVCDRFFWQALERRGGETTFEEVARALQRAASIKRYALLRFEPVPPPWSLAPVRDFIRLVEALGRAFGENRAILGVDVLCPGAEAGCSTAELRALADAFDKAFPYAFKFCAAGGALEALRMGRELQGLLVTPENAGLRQDKWPTLPLRMAVNPADPQAVQLAIERHVSILETTDLLWANTASHAGHRYLIQSVTIDDTDRQNHRLGASVALGNAGTAPCYADARFSIRLSGSDVACDRTFPLALRAADLQPGDSTTVTQALDTQGMPPGEYDVQIGLFCEGTGYPISMGVEGRISDGYYEGRLIARL